MASEGVPLNEYCLIQLPIFLKTPSLLKKVIGNEQEFISLCKQELDVPISIYPDNPYIGNTELHKKDSNKLILKVEKTGEKVSGKIIGKGIVTILMLKNSEIRICSFKHDGFYVSSRKTVL